MTRLRWAALSLALTAALICGCGSSEEPPTGQAEATVPVTGVEGEYDFGYVEPETKRYVRFDIDNPSAAAMTINKIFSECPCLIVQANPDSIAAGGSGAVHIEYASSEKIQHYTGRVIVYTSDPDRPKIALRIRSTVGLPLEVVQPVIEAGTLAPLEQRSVDAVVINHGQTPVRLTHGMSTNPACSVSVPQVAIPAGGRLRVPIRIRAGENPGRKGARISLHSDHPKQPKIEVKVKYTIAQPQP